MKQQEKLNHQEVMDALSGCFRELIASDITHRNMPNIINRGKAAAQLVTAMHREQIMEARRQATASAILEEQLKNNQGDGYLANSVIGLQQANKKLRQELDALRPKP